MPKVFLSPATHHKRCIVPNCSEAIHCAKICDAMVPLLDATGIEWARNDASTDDAMAHTRASNAYKPDVHFAFHTNAGGGKRCTFYNDGSNDSKRLSEAFAKRFGEIYPNLIKPSARYPADRLEERWNELKLTTAPAVYAEQWFHDNKEDSDWGHAHIQETAEAHVKSLCDWFGISYREATENPNDSVPDPAAPESDPPICIDYIVHAGIFRDISRANLLLPKARELFPSAYVSRIHDCYVVRCELNINRDYALKNAEQLEKLGINFCGILAREAEKR